MSVNIRSLHIGPDECDAIEDLRARASAQPLDLARYAAEAHTPEGAARMRDIINGLTIRLPTGFLASYTVSIQAVGPCRHLSVSVGEPGQGIMPHPGAVKVLACAFGFVGEWDDWMVWQDTPADGLLAVNILQPLSVVAEATA